MCTNIITDMEQSPDAAVCDGNTGNTEAIAMSNSQTTLPEGTDSILTGASDTGIDGNGQGAGSASYGIAPSRTDAPVADRLGDAAAKVGDATSSLRAQAVDKARDYAVQGKERAVGALQNVTQLVEDAAGTIDEKVGPQYGDYARQASRYVAGLADTLGAKDVDELVTDARDLVRKSPAIAIGAAAAIGFVVARIIKAGAPAEVEAGDVAEKAYAPASAHPVGTPSTASTMPVDYVS